MKTQRDKINKRLPVTIFCLKVSKNWIDRLFKVTERSLRVSDFQKKTERRLVLIFFSERIF